VALRSSLPHGFVEYVGKTLGGQRMLFQKQVGFSGFELHEEKSFLRADDVHAAVEECSGTGLDGSSGKLDLVGVSRYRGQGAPVHSLNPKILRAALFSDCVTENSAEKHERQLAVFKYLGKKGLHERGSKYPDFGERRKSVRIPRLFERDSISQDMRRLRSRA